MIGGSRINKKEYYAKKKRRYLEKKKRQRKQKIIFYGTVIGVLFAVLIVFYFQFSICTINGNSMAPLLNDGDRALVKKTANIQRFSVVDFYHKEAKENYVKRVIGVPGDEMVVVGKKMVLKLNENDESANLLTIELDTEVAQKLQEVSRIPNDSYFVLGENAKISNDSRHFGLIKAKDVVGQAFMKIAPINKMAIIQ